MELSIIIPAYNEEKRIGKTLEEYLSFFSKNNKENYEIIVVMNGCTDTTYGILESFKKKHTPLKILEFKAGIGKGGAVIEGFKIAKGDLIGFVDADNSTSAPEFEKCVKNILGYDGVIASRYIQDAVVEPKQPLSRRIASRGFNILIKILFGLRIKDSQCGAKLFRKDVIKKILPDLGITRWAFDVDLLYQLKRNRFVVKEIPILWKDSEGSTLNVRKATIEMFLAVTRLRLIYSPLRVIVKVYDKLF